MENKERNISYRPLSQLAQNLGEFRCWMKSLPCKLRKVTLDKKLEEQYLAIEPTSNLLFIIYFFHEHVLWLLWLCCFRNVQRQIVLLICYFFVSRETRKEETRRNELIFQNRKNRCLYFTTWTVCFWTTSPPTA